MKYWLSLLAILVCIFILTACGTQAAQKPQVSPTLSAAEIQGTEQANTQATAAAMGAIMTQAQQTFSALQASLPTITPTPEPYWPGEWMCFAEKQMTAALPFTLFQEGDQLSDPDAQLAQGVYQLEGTISADGLTVTGAITQGGVQMTTFVWQRSTEDAFIGYWDAEYSEGAFCCARPGTPLPEPCLLEH